MIYRRFCFLISKILIAYDGTECADRALDFSLDLAERLSASLTIINVLEPPPYGNPEDPLQMSPGMAGLVNDLRKTHQEILLKASKKVSNANPNLRFSTELKEGNPSTQIVDTASEENFDVIVVGHGGASRIREMFLGGTSERVAHLARCAVLIVK
jgi:nucleotide-binding universal stress UspA family protein